jgi:hypothetical protein
MHKITKLKASDEARFPTAETHDEYRKSVENSVFSYSDDHLSPNVDYWTIGDILRGPTIGESLIMDRWMRNGQLIRGTFKTSRVTKITEDGFETQNSVYKIEEVDDEEILSLTSHKTLVS